MEFEGQLTFVIGLQISGQLGMLRHSCQIIAGFGMESKTAADGLTSYKQKRIKGMWAGRRCGLAFGNSRRYIYVKRKRNGTDEKRTRYGTAFHRRKVFDRGKLEIVFIYPSRLRHPEYDRR